MRFRKAITENEEMLGESCGTNWKKNVENGKMKIYHNFVTTFFIFLNFPPS